MNKKRLHIFIWITFLILSLSLVTGLGCAKSDTASDEKQLYTCGMHPQVIQDEPGLCPICNMKLVPLSSSSSNAGNNSGDRVIHHWEDPLDPTYVSDKPGTSPSGKELIPLYEDEIMADKGVTIDPTMVQNIGVRYADVTRGPLVKTIRAAAHVDYNEDNLAVLSTRTDGWIEKLHVTSVGAKVKKGEPLFDFFSPQLYSAREEYTIALRSGDPGLIRASKERLKLLGVPDSQISSINANSDRRVFTFTAPISGAVISIGNGSGNRGISGGSMSGSSSGMEGMSGGSSSSKGGMSSGSGATIREGGFVASGTAVFTIADLSSLWVYSHIYEDELPFVKIGMKANLELEYLPDEVIEGTIDFIYPFLDKQTRDIKIRMTVPNEERKLLPEMYGKMVIESRISEDTLLVPSEAIIFSGDSKVVFLALGKGRFAPQEIKTGASDRQGFTQVLGGLLEGDTVVSSAQFMIDSESRLKEALNQMLAGRIGTPSGHQHGTTTPSAAPQTKQAETEKERKEWANLAPDDPKAKFRCPMPEDRYYSEFDGECPICGMFLEPHDPEKWAEEHDH